MLQKKIFPQLLDSHWRCDPGESFEGVMIVMMVMMMMTMMVVMMVMMVVMMVIVNVTYNILQRKSQLLVTYFPHLHP